MKRSDLTEKLLDIKREKGWTWKHICERIGGYSEVLIVGAILGQMKLTKPQAANAAELFGLSKAETALLNEVPIRGTPMPPTDPLIYRFYELVMVNGPAWKALIEEEFGDGIMSAIDFDMVIDRLQQKFAHLGADFVFGDGNSFGGKIALQLVDHRDLAAFVELGRDGFPGVGDGFFARQSELCRHPQSDEAVATCQSLELQLLVHHKLLLKGFLALVEGGHGKGSPRCRFRPPRSHCGRRPACLNNTANR